MFPLLLHFFSSLTVIIDEVSPHLHIRNCQDSCNIIATHISYWLNKGGFGHILSLFRPLVSVLFWAQMKKISLDLTSTKLILWRKRQLEILCFLQTLPLSFSLRCPAENKFAEIDALLIISLHLEVFKRLSAFIMILFLKKCTLPYHIPTSSLQWWLIAWLMHKLMVLQISVHPAGNETISSFLNRLVCWACSPSSLRHSAVLQKDWIRTSLTNSWYRRL